MATRDVDMLFDTRKRIVSSLAFNREASTALDRRLPQGGTAVSKWARPALLHRPQQTV